MNNKEKGYMGEKIAVDYLIDKGFSILSTNYKTRRGEIDIIANIEDTLVFVEVKSRTSINYGYPAEAVNKKKMLTIINTSNIYMLQNKIYNNPIRFDVIEVYLGTKQINHIENAFYGVCTC